MIKKIKKKKAKATKKARIYSRPINLYNCFSLNVKVKTYTPVDPNPPSPRLVLSNFSTLMNLVFTTGAITN